VKSHATLLEAFAGTLRANSRTKLVIAGDGPCRAALEGHAAQLSLGDKIVFLGEVSDAERILNGLDVYMLSSIDEGMNLTLLEAMATQLPVVATAVGGNPEVVEHGVSGFIVPALRPDLMSAQMLALAGNQELRRSMAAAALDRAWEQYSQRRTISSYERLYMGARGSTVSSTA
jgi:L-malate glycosyltransferase